MTDLRDGESTEVKGSARLPYILKNTGGVYSCSCPAWRNQSVAIERRTCKHLRSLRGEEAEAKRIGAAPPARPKPTAPEGADGDEHSAAPGLLLAQPWTNDVDLTGWWISEKLDGVRAYWDGKQFLSRQGNLFHAPDWFVENFPATPLDGELWRARKSFQRTVSIVRRQDKSDLWRELQFRIFDAPTIAEPFEQRIGFLRDCLSRLRLSFAGLLPQMLCRGSEHLREEMDRIEALGGEGLMLRQPASRYEAGRSATLLKVKRFHDAEARVVEHLPGAGRHKGRLGALSVELADGTRFSVGTGFSDAQRSQPPPIGSTITFRYQELTDRGAPRFPSFLRVRGDADSAPRVRDGAAPVALAPAALAPAALAKAVDDGASAAKYPTAVNPTAVNPMAVDPTAVDAAAKDAAQARRFEFVAGNAAKFWEVSVRGADVTVRFGRLGAEGQTQTKSLADAQAALRHKDKLIGEKTAKGYRETTGGAD